jgi:hypothetical protein
MNLSTGKNKNQHVLMGLIRLYNFSPLRGSIPLSSTKIKQGVNSRGLTPFFVDCMVIVSWGFFNGPLKFILQFL